MGLPLGTNIIIVSLVFTLLDIVVLSARFLSIRITKNKVHLDDYLIIFGVLATISQCVLTICNVEYASLGYHLLYTPEGAPVGDAAEKLALYDRLAWALQLTVPIGNTFIRLSILFFLRRIFRGSAFNISSWILIGLSLAWGISIFFATLFECTKPQDVPKVTWSMGSNYSGSRCYFPLNMFYANVTSDVIIDALIWTLPHPFVWRLHMPVRRRIGVSAVFAVGLVVIAVGICRVYFIFNIALSDFTYTEAPSQYWTVIESAVANFCACLPTMVREPISKEVEGKEVDKTELAALHPASPAQSRRSTSASGTSQP